MNYSDVIGIYRGRIKRTSKRITMMMRYLSASIHLGKVCKNNLVSMCFNDLWKHTKYDTEGEYLSIYIFIKDV